MIVKPIDTKGVDYLKLVEKAGSVFNLPNWLAIYNPENIVTLGIFNLNNELIGALNLYKSKKAGTTYYSVPPYSPSNGFTLINPAQSNANKIAFEKDVHEALIKHFALLKAALFISAFPTNVIDTQPYFWNKYKVIPNYTYQLPLNKTEEELFESITSEKRKSIRKAQKDNIIVSECTDMKIVLELINKTFSRKEKSINESLVKKILFQFSNSENSFAFVAYQNNKPIACTFCVYYKNTSYYLFGGYDEANKHHGAGPLCMWSAILKAKQLAITVFDFEGSMLPEVEKYFREFGGELKPYYTVQKAWLPIEMLLKFKQRNRF